MPTCGHGHLLPTRARRTTPGFQPSRIAAVGQVDLIQTDPPYNTGNDLRYNDRWETDPNDRGLGDFISADDAARHTKWMRFMYPRLQLMKSMLKPGGVLAICIDHRELFHLGQLLDELFREDNRLAIINWQKTW